MKHTIKGLFAASAFAASVIATSTGAWAQDPKQCQTVRLSDVGWLDISSTNGVANFLLTSLGYDVDLKTLSVPVTYQSLQNNDIDVFLGNWMPAQQKLIKPYMDKGTVEHVKQNLDGAKYTLAVPTYLADKGLKSFADIAKFKDELDGQILGLESGNQGNAKILKMIETDTFGLKDFSVTPSSEAGMLSAALRRNRREQPYVMLAWEPHPMNVQLDLTYLDGGDDWFGPNYGGATVHTVTRAGYSDLCPNVGKLLSQLTYSLKMENEIMGLIAEGEEPDVAAKAWLQKHPDALEGWLKDVMTRDGNDGLSKVRQALAE